MSDDANAVDVAKFQLRVLLGNTLPFIDADRFIGDSEYRRTFYQFALGAATGSSEAKELQDAQVFRELCIDVLKEVLEMSTNEATGVVERALADSNRDAIKHREAGAIAMTDLERALKRFTYITS